ncbi:MAG: xanthine dehydrogenase family protein molybdopterin-binding subunit [Alphaproteobacteria bacterium]
MTIAKGLTYSERELKQIGKRPLRPDGVDKVTGRARYGADLSAPGMLIAKVLRSPHPHARIHAIDTTKAEALAGVKAVITRDDFPDVGSGERIPSEGDEDLRYTAHNVMARDKALYEGHTVAAVAAISAAIANKALGLIEVDYEPLPHVTDVDEAMKPDAPVLHDDMFTSGVEPTPDTPSNVAQRVEVSLGDTAEGFSEADIVIERDFTTEAVHQGYIEPQACLATVSGDGSAELWCCTQGHFSARNSCAKILDMEMSKLRVTASEIGGGFGGKTQVFIEPLALALSRKAGRPVKLVMSREDVFKGTGPTASTSMSVKVGVTKDGRITAAEAVLKYQGGAFPSAPTGAASMTAFACYDIAHVLVVGYVVVTNRPKAAAYRAPGAPMAAFAVESVMDEIAGRVGMDPINFRLKNAPIEGSQAAYGPKFGAIGYVETLEAAKAHEHYQVPLKPGQGRGVASGYWFNWDGETCVTLNIQDDGTAAVAVGTPDIGGSRASMCQMVAEELGIDYSKVQATVVDTNALGFNDVTGGSRVTFACGMAAIQAARNVIEDLCARAAGVWGISPDAVVWEDGAARPSGDNAGKFDPMPLTEIAKLAAKTGGPIAGHAEFTAKGAGVSFSTQIVDVEVDRETGKTTILRYTVIQDAGKAIHPSYVEGQYQGGAAQGIGWALNEEYVYGEDGKLQNAGFLDYRMPVASDLPMIDTVIVEVPNPNHPYGVRGVGETSIIPPMGAIANALAAATGLRMNSLPMSPPKLLKALDEAAPDQAAE